MAELPSGTVTFLYTDIEGSTRLWEQAPTAMRAAVARQDALVRQAVAAHAGAVFRTAGDGLCAAFAAAPDAVAAALASQRALQAEAWDEVGPLRVRMVLHTGAVEVHDGDYVGACLNRLARLLAAARGGQVLLSGAVQALARDALPPGASLRDLGEHRLRDLVQPERVFQLLHAELPADVGPLTSLDALAHNLPAPLTSFVGRERALARVADLLAATRLLTLTGAGGVGKTRLALQVAAGRLADYPDGVWLVEVARLTDPALVPGAAAAALGVREQPGQPLLTTLLAAIRGKRLLLLLDNCEHLLDACARLVETILRGCPGARVLATSREGLGVAGEIAWRAPSLAAPRPDRLPPLAELARAEGVALFVERAAAALPGFALSERNAAAVAQICWRLDGIPLALELAAARVTVLSVEQIADRLDDCFRLLTGGSRTAVPRQQTLRAAIDWSYALLSPAERAVLRRLAAFAGGCSLAAAEYVCDGEWESESDGEPTQSGSPSHSFIPSPIPSLDVLDLLARLVDKSMLLMDEGVGGEARYRLLETVRQYAAERLQAAGEAAAVRRRHRDWFQAWAEPTPLTFEGADLVDRLEAEHDNLRAALAWSLGEADGAEAGLRLAGSLRTFWYAHGHYSEGLRWLEALLAARGTASAAAQAKALLAAGWLARHLDDYDRATAYLEECLALEPECADRAYAALALGMLGEVARNRGDFERARDLTEASLARARATGSAERIGLALSQVGGVARYQGDAARAEPALAECLRQSRSDMTTALALWHLGRLAHSQRDEARALAMLEESLALCEAAGFTRGVAHALHGLGLIDAALGDRRRAATLLRESLRLRREQGNREGMAECLEGLASVSARLRAPGVGYGGADSAPGPEAGDGPVDRLEALARTARLLGAADALRAAIRAPLPPADRPDVEATRTAARAGLGAPAFASLWEGGQALTLEETMAEALAEEGGDG